MKEFLERWGVKHRVSSAYYPRANKFAEVGVKSLKRIVRENLRQDGSLNTDKLARALLMHRNSPCPITGLSPAQVIFGRVLRDHLPLQPGKFEVRKEWRQEADLREKAYTKRHILKQEQLQQGTKSLPSLVPGDHVYIQAQSGNKPLLWNKSGTVLEPLGYDSYSIKVDGSNLCTQRHRRFLRKFTPFSSLPREYQTPVQVHPNTRSTPRLLPEDETQKPPAEQVAPSSPAPVPFQATTPRPIQITPRLTPPAPLHPPTTDKRILEERMQQERVMAKATRVVAT